MTLKIFNHNVYNHLVDLGALSNVMPYSVYRKLNVEPGNRSTNMIQKDRDQVKVIGELNDVLIWIASNPKVHQVINIIIDDIPNAHGPCC